MPNLLFAAAARQRELSIIHTIEQSFVGNIRSLLTLIPLTGQMEKLTANLDFDGVDPELAWHLLDLHWNRQHHAFMVTYRPAFMRDMASGGPYFSRILLNAIYFGAAKFSPRLELRKVSTDVRTAGWQFRDRVRDLLGRALDYSNITTIQALLLMCNSLFALGDEPSAAWIYAGNAFRMIIDLGLHVDVTSRSNMRHLTDEDIEVRRRVFWAAFGKFVVLITRVTSSGSTLVCCVARSLTSASYSHRQDPIPLPGPHSSAARSRLPRPHQIPGRVRGTRTLAAFRLRFTLRTQRLSLLQCVDILRALQAEHNSEPSREHNVWREAEVATTKPSNERS
jgi:hypothetical protein